MTKKILTLMLVLAFCLTLPASAQVITSVVRSGGASDDRDPIGPYDGSTAPLATEAGGLRDGQVVFSDRTYPYVGIPEEYLGTAYIRTFNNDKNGGTVDVTYEVTTGEAAIVWISVDDRIPAEWDADGTIVAQQDAVDLATAAIGPAGTFADSGVDIFVREKDDGSTDRPMSVYAAELPAGTYVFGSMDSGKNFYGLGAIGSVTPPEPDPEPEPEPVPPLDISLGVKINFQVTGDEVPEGYLPDGGEVFDDRLNGISYGWNMDSTGGARNRNSNNAPDERYDTTNHMEKGQHRIWEIALPTGIYDLLVACGEPSNTDQINNLDIEGVVVLDPDGEDNFDEYNVTVAVSDGLLTIQMAPGADNAKIMFVDIMPAVSVLSDVTTPGDTILGVPNDGDWPGGEPPAYAFDNNSGTKYLHFKGDFDAGDPLMGAGIQITPADGESIVSGLTFTAANDSPNRDPVVYALYGSNASIDGPYELIACGYIVDFAQEEAWPRFAKNETEIAFDNDVIYEHYQLQFIDIRDIATANSMQIAEVELIGIKLKATDPEPADGEVAIGLDDDISWTSGSLAFSNEVYFGTEFPLPFAGTVAGLKRLSFDPGVLEYGTTYYWQVDTVEEDGTVRAGAVNSFTTTIPVGLFEYTKDIGGPAGIGRTTYEGYVWKNDTLSEQYRIMGGGSGINDQFHLAWNRVSGDVRISASFEWIVASDDSAMMGVMLRAGTAGGDNSHSNVSTKNDDPPKRMGIQRITVDGIVWIESLADFGNGWESTDLVPIDDLPDEVLAGIVITSNNNSHLVQARATDVTYELNPSMVGSVPAIPGDQALDAPPSDVSGFSIRSLKPLVADGFNSFDAMNTLLDTGMWNGLPAMPGSEGTRIDEFVNLRDTGNGAFSEGNGYPDASYPGIDPLEVPAQDPAAGDDDNDFATEILGYIQLVPGEFYKFATSSDDGSILEIGGVEVVRTNDLQGASNWDSALYIVDVEGYYPLRARTFERGGGASIELHQVLLDGTRILLNDVASGGAAVFAPAQ